MNEYERLQDELKVRAPLINEAFEEQAGRHAHWSERAAESGRRARDAKLHAETVQAQLFLEYRTQVIQNEGKVPPEWYVTALVHADPRRINAWTTYNQAQYTADVMGGASAAFAQRKDMLVSYATNLRVELGGQLRTRHSFKPQIDRQEEPPQTPPDEYPDYEIIDGQRVDRLEAIAEAAEQAREDPTEVRHCSVCTERQRFTTSGWVCANGHGGAPRLQEAPSEHLPLDELMSRYRNR